MRCVATFLCLASATRDAGAEPPPNIVFIFVDDQGYYDLGCYGATEVQTPRIDAMAAEGIRLTDYYAAAPICSPSRAGLLTGCYPRRVGNAIWVHRADSQSGIHPDELTLPELLKTGGYATACIGKWHLGFQEPFLPRNQGFDHYFGLLHNLDPVEVVYFEDEGGVPLLRNGEVVKRPADPAELTRLYTDEAISFIKQHRDGPFFLYLPHTMLHNPLGVSEAFKGSSNWGEYGDAIQELDFHVGRLLDSLQELGIAERTLVVYASDNGRGPGRTPEQKIRGRKLSTYEGGIRVPAIAWGPELGLQRNVESSAVVRAMDWYPTLATIAGIQVPEGRVIDGRDITPLLKGESRVVPPPGANRSLNASVPLRRRWDPPGEWAPIINRNEYNDAFFYHGSQGALAAVRWKNWKLYLNPSLELYDLATDPGETQLVRNRDITRKLRGMAILLQEEMRLDARPAGQAPAPRREDGRTAIPQETLAGLDAKLGVTYARYGDRELQMDVYRPKQAWGSLPAVVCIHGGGWANGKRASHEKVAQGLASRGYVAATISYRLSGEAPFPAAIHDCKAAVRFLRAHAKEYGIDAEKMGAIGLSAGGHLTALLATSAGVRELEGDGGNPSFSSAIQAAVPMGAQTDLLSDRTREVSSLDDRGRIWRQFLGGSQEQRADTYRLASPLHHLDREDAPCWFIAGETDDPSTHADAFRQRMKELGVRTDLSIIQDAPHAFLGKQVWFDQMIETADAFFRQTLK
ncbi:sulfatase-like hydrolase/transferase [Roseiconus nitratireducens]|uniref:Sulfatase-like hydrolase/transferase n=1 Tax=Roseiconus nitratireducens TaxID=2605748 RepID=A0A5M6DDA1_9BACT|nr:sulfatase-like hydrolase/transferase [Roseiconus nitratireducens]KAA5545383.1 sulfatase-like hydrolase/transferase [Roseiconus nitratireducens]